MTDIFNETNVEAKFEDLVGEGKKYSDNDAAAKAIVEKDRFIARLLEEARRKEETLQQALNTKAFEDRIKALEQAKLTEREEPLPREVTPPQAPVEVDEDAIARVLEKREAANTRSRNLLVVKDKLTEAYGEAYPSRVKARAAELGISMDHVNRMAAETPTALFALLRLDVPHSVDNPAPPATRQNTAAFIPESSVRGNKFYSDLRKTKPAEYYSPKVQMEEYNALKKLGPEKFYAS